MTKKATKTQTSEQANPPVAKIRVGLITASIWERKTDNGTFYATTFERRYRNGDGEWKTTHSYDTPDLLTVGKVVDLAHTKILELQNGEDAEAE